MGTVIKADGVGRIKKRLESFALKDHMAEAHRVVRESHAEASRIIEAAGAEVERLKAEARRQARDEGYAEGHEAGYAAGRAQALESAKAEFLARQETLLSALNAMMSGFEQSKDDLLDRARHDILELAVAVAERITRRTAVVDCLAAVENAKAAVLLVTDESDIVIRINAADREAMREYAACLAESFDRRRHIKIVEDPSIGPGGCLIETPSTRVDATIDWQLREAVTLFLRDDTVLDPSTHGERST